MASPAVFISHAEEDAGLAVEVARGLETAGYGTWYYERDNVPGVSYLRQIVDAIGSCEVVVLILSPAALGSNQVDREVIQALEAGKAFLPLLVGLSHAEYRAQRPDWAMATGAASSVPVPPGGAGAVLPRLLHGLEALSISATAATTASLTSNQPQVRKSQSPAPSRAGPAAAGITCPMCGASNSLGSVYCLLCGFALPAPNVPNAPIAVAHSHVTTAPNPSLGTSRKAGRVGSISRALIVGTVVLAGLVGLPLLRPGGWSVFNRGNAESGIATLDDRGKLAPRATTGDSTTPIPLNAATHSASATAALNTATPTPMELRQQIEDWLAERQMVKEATTRPPYDETQITQVLAGASLGNELRAIRWLRDNRAWYRYLQSSSSIETLEVTDENHVRARMRKTESHDLIYEQPARVVPTRDDTYIVVYDLVKTDRWRAINTQFFRLDGTPINS